QAADGIRDFHVTGVQTCALPIWLAPISISCMVIAGEKCRCIVPAPPGRPYPRPMNDPQFPISPLLPQVRDTLAAHPRLVLEAPRSEERRVGKDGRRRWGSFA